MEAQGMLSGILQHMVIHVLSLEVLCECHFQADNNITLTFQCEITWTVITVVAKIPF